MGIRSSIETRVGAGLETHGDEHDDAVLTWRYLRIGLDGLAIGLGVSVVYERARAECWQTSISAFYYTPAQGILVGALVAIGVCLICLRGASDGEDVLLNFAGLCAPFVALVPTPNKKQRCGSVLIAAGDRDLAVGNNITALLIVAWLAVALLAVFTLRRWLQGGGNRLSRIDIGGYGAAVAILLITTILFITVREPFLRNAHHVAAISLFGFVFLNVWLNAVQRYLTKRGAGVRARRFNLYAQIGVLMAADALAHVVLWQAGFEHWIFTIEASLIALFAVFWLVQTVERWDNGITPALSPPPPPGSGDRR